MAMTLHQCISTGRETIWLPAAAGLAQTAHEQTESALCLLSNQLFRRSSKGLEFMPVWFWGEVVFRTLHSVVRIAPHVRGLLDNVGRWQASLYVPTRYVWHLTVPRVWRPPIQVTPTKGFLIRTDTLNRRMPPTVDARRRVDHACWGRTPLFLSWWCLYAFGFPHHVTALSLWRPVSVVTWQLSEFGDTIRQGFLFLLPSQCDRVNWTHPKFPDVSTTVTDIGSVTEWLVCWPVPSHVSLHRAWPVVIHVRRQWTAAWQPFVGVRHHCTRHLLVTVGAQDIRLLTAGTGEKIMIRGDTNTPARCCSLAWQGCPGCSGDVTAVTSVISTVPSCPTSCLWCVRGRWQWQLRVVTLRATLPCHPIGTTLGQQQLGVSGLCDPLLDGGVSPLRGHHPRHCHPTVHWRVMAKVCDTPRGRLTGDRDWRWPPLFLSPLVPNMVGTSVGHDVLKTGAYIPWHIHVTGGTSWTTAIAVNTQVSVEWRVFIHHLLHGLAVKPRCHAVTQPRREDHPGWVAACHQGDALRLGAVHVAPGPWQTTWRVGVTRGLDGFNGQLLLTVLLTWRYLPAPRLEREETANTQYTTTSSRGQPDAPSRQGSLHPPTWAPKKLFKPVDAL